MSQPLLQILLQLDFFKVIFGGKFTIDSKLIEAGFITLKPSAILLSGFIAAVIATILLLVIFICHRSKLLGKTSINVLSIIAIALFIVGGVMFALKDIAAKDQVAQTLRLLGRPESAVLESYKYNYLDLGTTPIIFMVASFIAAGSLTTGLIVKNVRRY